MSGRDERPSKRKVPVVETPGLAVTDWLAGRYPGLMRIDRNEIRRVRRESARNATLINSVFFAFGLFVAMWSLLTLNLLIVPVSIACVFLFEAMQKNIEVYRDNRGDVVEEELFVRYRRKTD